MKSVNELLKSVSECCLSYLDQHIYRCELTGEICSEVCTCGVYMTFLNSDEQKIKERMDALVNE